MAIKCCRGCKRRLSIRSFYVNKRMADGHLNFCDKCVNDRIATARNKNKKHFLKIQEKSRRKSGIPCRDECKNKQVILSRHHENSVAKYYKILGYDVNVGNGKGPDLVASKNGVSLKIEVKSAWRHINCNTWYVDSVMPLRKSDDLVAILFRKNKKLILFITPMSDHLKHCSKCGKRCVTKLYWSTEGMIEL